MKSKRVGYIDVARGIAILAVVAGHLFEGRIKKIIFSFHLPLFIIVSGYFFRSEKIKNKDKMVRYLSKLLVPYIITNVVTSLLFLKDHSFLETIKLIVLKLLFSVHHWGSFSINQAYGVGALWFIPMLIAMEFLYYFMIKFLKKNSIITVGVIALDAVGLYLGKKSLFLPWSLDVALVSLLFFHVGYLLKYYNILDKLLNNKFVILVSFGLWIFLMMSIKTISLSYREYSGQVLFYVEALAGSFIIFKLSKYIIKIKFISDFFRWWGKNSLDVLCFHNIELSIINYQSLGLYNVYLIFILKICIISIGLYLLNKVMNYKLNKGWCL